MTIVRSIAAAAILASGFAIAAPASAAITTFADYSGVGGANLYWQRTGSDYTVATTASVIASGAVPKPALAKATPGHPLTPAQIASNAAKTTAYNAAVAAQIPIQTAASAAAARATAGGHLFTIATPKATTPGAVATHFSFLTPTAASPLHFLAALGSLNASFRLDATAGPGVPAQTAFGLDIQPLTTGSFSFIYTGTKDLKVHRSVYHTGANLLTATIFNGGNLSGGIRATSGGVNASTTGGNTIVYTSDFLNFDLATDKDFALSLTSITKPLGFTVNQALNSFFATTTGSFSTDPAPHVVAIVPEPATWALLVMGFGLVGVRTRLRGRATSVTA